MEKEYIPIKAFNDHSNCKGHANFMLDCEYTKKDERDTLEKVLTHYINKYEKVIS